MLTVVALLLLPFVLGMSVFRAVQVPRQMLSQARRWNPRHPFVAAVAAAAAYIALVAYTTFVLYTAARMVLGAPQTVQELFSVAAACAGYPFVYVAFEWVMYYSVRSGQAARR